MEGVQQVIQNVAWGGGDASRLWRTYPHRKTHLRTHLLLAADYIRPKALKNINQWAIRALVAINLTKWDFFLLLSFSGLVSYWWYPDVHRVMQWRDYMQLRLRRTHDWEMTRQQRYIYFPFFSSFFYMYVSHSHGDEDDDSKCNSLLLHVIRERTYLSNDIVDVSKVMWGKFFIRIEWEVLSDCRFSNYRYSIPQQINYI